MRPKRVRLICAPASFIDRLARGVVTRQLSGLRRGEICLRDDSGTFSLGQPGELHAKVQVHRERFFRHAMLGGTLSVAESYLRGDWDCDDLTSLFRIFVRNRHAADRLDRGLVRIAGYGHRLFHWCHANTRGGSRRNIGAHYDLGNDFFELWLDDTMAYSSAIFPSPGATLREGSLEKFDRIGRLLDLQPADEVLEIGGGWGGFAVYSASQFGCEVTTTTISQEQFDFAQRRINAAGLARQVKLLRSDYRDLNGQFDKLTSIEMIEAVGHKFLDQYFSQCSRLLRPDGSLVLQAIVMPEQGYGEYLKSVDFIQRYVFPGGCLPSLGSILSSVGRASDLRFSHADDYSPHYAETLRRRRAAFHSKLNEVRELGYSEQFIRLWNYYLCYCEAAFEERCVGVLQIRLDKPECRRDPVGLNQPVASEPAQRDDSNLSLRSHGARTLCEN